MAQTNEDYAVNISESPNVVADIHLKLGTNKNSKGVVLSANNFCFLKNDKPWYPVMGEIHFSRVAKEKWESSILKMKACGINIIATYVFWIYHEEEKGVWRWNADRDLKEFVRLCARHEMYVWLRIGPWCHGEVRNGGFPDWVLKETKPRTNDSLYLQYAHELYSQVHKQANQFYFKNGGTIIGVQIENEFRFNSAKGLSHMLTLKKMAFDIGIDVPFYSATGWPGSDVKQNELMPVWGAYAEAPWDKRTIELPLSDNYLFSAIKNDGTIGNDLVASTKDTTTKKAYPFPYATAEMGAGIQVTHHRRPIVSPKDVLGLAIAKLGAGANLLGYYMFHGGNNDIGKYSTLQESKSTKYPNDYALIDYNFQAPIGAFGEINESYYYFKKLHYFLESFGDVLSICNTYFPYPKINKGDSTSLRWAVRAKEGRGFVFINQYQRQLKMKDVEQVQFAINDKNTILQFPEKPIRIPANTQAIFPFNLALGNANLIYATAQPITFIPNSNSYFFFAHNGIQAEYLFTKENIKNIKAVDAIVKPVAKGFLLKVTQPSKNAIIYLTLTNGSVLKLITLSEAEALNTWVLTVNNKKQLAIANTNLYSNGKEIIGEELERNAAQISYYSCANSLQVRNVLGMKKQINGLYTSYYISFEQQNSTIPFSLNNEWTSKAMALAKTDTATAVVNFPLYDTSLNAIKGAYYYDLAIPTSVKEGLMSINYEGEALAIYTNNRIMADDFNDDGKAECWINASKDKTNYTCLITPFVEGDKIYLQPNANIRFTDKPSLNKIVIKPLRKGYFKGF